MASPAAVQEMGDTLVHLLRTGSTSTAVSAANIKLSTPAKFGDFKNPAQPTITLFLYRIAVNPTMRNGPHRVFDDGRCARPLLPVELYYLITPWAKDVGDEHKIAGLVLQTLYDRAELGPADLQGASWSPDDSVQLVLESLPTEEHFRIWENAEAPYRLSLTYMACSLTGGCYPPVMDKTVTVSGITASNP